MFAKSTNSFTGSRLNMNSRAPHQRHRNDMPSIPAHASQICCAKSWNMDSYVFRSFERLVLSRFEIIKHECVAISFNTLIGIFDSSSSHSYLFADFLLAMPVLVPFPEFFIEALRQRAACNTNDSKTVTNGTFYNKLRRNRIAILN